MVGVSSSSLLSPTIIYKQKQRVSESGPLFLFSLANNFLFLPAWLSVILVSDEYYEPWRAQSAP